MNKAIVIPQDFQAVLEEHRRIRDGFRFLDLTDQQEYIEWITSAGTPEERERRIYESIEKLKDEIE